MCFQEKKGLVSVAVMTFTRSWRAGKEMECRRVGNGMLQDDLR